MGKEDNIEEPAFKYGTSSQIENNQLTEEQIENLIQAHPERPCQFTQEQLRERVIKGMEEIKKGEYITHEEMKKRFIS